MSDLSGPERDGKITHPLRRVMAAGLCVFVPYLTTLKTDTHKPTHGPAQHKLRAESKHTLSPPGSESKSVDQLV